MDAPQPYHRLFGLMWMDFFRGLPVTVELEKDLSLKQQLLDVVILRKEAGDLPRTLPDGFEELVAHNLITFKSHQDALDGWALNELVGHYVNYRKQVSPAMNDLLPEEDFRLYAVCVRFPQGLARRTRLRLVQQGVYEATHFTGSLRVIVVHQLAQEQQNALLHLFSAQPDQVYYGQENYDLHSRDASRILQQLFQRYRAEGVIMPDLLEQFAREMDQKMLSAMSFEERLKGIPLEERLKGLPAEERLKGIPPEERLKGLSPDELTRLRQLLEAQTAPKASENPSAT